MIATLFVLWQCALMTGVSHLDAVTLVEIEHNREAKKLEVAVRFYPEQLERALAVGSGRRISLERTSDVDRLLQEYLAKNFNVFVESGGKEDVSLPPAKISWVGKEVDSKEVWVYFEVPCDGTLAGKTIRDTMLLEINPEQVNTVNIVEGDRVGTCVLSRRTPQAKVILRAKERKKSPTPAPGIPF